MTSAGRLLLGPAQADDNVEHTPPPDLQSERQEKGHPIHALSSERQAGQSGLPQLLAPGYPDNLEKPGLG